MNLDLKRNNQQKRRCQQRSSKHDILERVDDYIQEPVKEVDDKQEIFDRTVDFIIDLHPDSLSDEQLEEVMEILDLLEFEEIEEQQKQTKYKGPYKRRPKLTDKTPMKKLQYARKYRRRNPAKIKKKRIQLQRSGEGRKRKRLKPLMAKRNLTPTGKDPRRNRRKGTGQGGDRKKKKDENGKQNNRVSQRTR